MRKNKIVQLAAWHLIADPQKWHVGQRYAGPIEGDLIEGPIDYLYFKTEEKAKKYAKDNNYYDWEISSFNSSKSIRYWRKKQSIIN